MSRTPYELVVFDWDGTLMDSAHQIVRCFEGAFSEVDLPSPGPDAIRRIIGLGLTEAVAELMPQYHAVARLAVTERYRKNFLALDAGEMTLFPGVRAGLEALVAEGYMLAIATGKSRRGLDRVLAATGLADLFVATRCADEAFSKPHPKMLEDLLEHTGMTAPQAVMIGDTTYDLLMARSAGMAGLAVSYGVHARDELLAHAPIACCDSFEEVYAWIRSASALSPSAKAAQS